MQLEQLMEKSEQIQYRLICLLHQESPNLPLKSLLTLTGLSKATLLKYLEAIEEHFDQHGLDARLVQEEEGVSLFLGLDLAWEDLVSSFLGNAIKYQILLYLLSHTSFTIQGLSQDLLVSEATLNRHLASLNQELQVFDLAINQGRLRGEELQIRYFYMELLSLTWSKERRQTYCDQMGMTSFVPILNRLVGEELGQLETSQVNLWMAITAQRMTRPKKEFRLLKQAMEDYRDNVFFQRIDQAYHHFVARRAVSIDSGEGMVLFAFLLGYGILPQHRASYALGFGGPISEKITPALRLMRQADLLVDDLHGYTIASLGKLLSQLYFFKGRLSALDQGFSGEELLLLGLLPETYHPLLEDLYQFFLENLGQAGWVQHYQLRLDLLNLLILIVDKSQVQLRVGIHLPSDQRRDQVLILLLHQHLENNRLIALETYQAGKDYDCLISASPYTQTEVKKTYWIKTGFNAREVYNLSLFLKDCLLQKNQSRRDELDH